MALPISSGEKYWEIPHHQRRKPYTLGDEPPISAGAKWVLSINTTAETDVLPFLQVVLLHGLLGYSKHYPKKGTSKTRYTHTHHTPFAPL